MRVQNVAPIEPFEVDGDAYVPVRVKWQTKYAVRPIYLRLKGDNGGSLEFRIDPANGRLIGLVVLELPPRRLALGAPTASAGESGLPVFDLSPWHPNPDMNPTIDVVKQVGPLWLERGDPGVLVRIDDDAVSRWIDAGPICFGVGSHQELAAFHIPGKMGEDLRMAVGL